MYLGKIVEVALVRGAVPPAAAPVHDRAALGRPGARTRGSSRTRRRIVLKGDIPSPGQPAVGLPVPHPLLAARAPRQPGDLRDRRSRCSQAAPGPDTTRATSPPATSPRTSPTSSSPARCCRRRSWRRRRPRPEPTLRRGADRPRRPSGSTSGSTMPARDRSDPGRPGAPTSAGRAAVDAGNAAEPPFVAQGATNRTAAVRTVIVAGRAWRGVGLAGMTCRRMHATSAEQPGPCARLPYSGAKSTAHAQFGAGVISTLYLPLRFFRCVIGST